MAELRILIKTPNSEEEAAQSFTWDTSAVGSADLVAYISSNITAWVISPFIEVAFGEQSFIEGINDTTASPGFIQSAVAALVDF